MSRGAGRHRAVVSLGSNVDRERTLPLAVAGLASTGGLVAVSSAWETAAVGRPGQPPFFNAAALLATHLDPWRLKNDVLRPLEAALGRERSADRFAPRRIDLDIVLYDELVTRLPDGTSLPDPDLGRYLHLAVPLAELLPEACDPRTGERFGAVAARLLAAHTGEPPRRVALELHGGHVPPQ